jgi:uncharacterized protein (TIGR03086 family)
LGVVPDLRPLHRAALAAADDVVRPLTAPELDRPTPCAGWTLADLLAHMIGQHHGFAAAVRDGGAPSAAYAPRPFTRASWERSLAVLGDAFAAADLDAEVVLVEIAPEPRSVAWAVGAHLLDTVVHTWDVARARDVPHEPAADLAAAVVRAAALVPEAGRTQSGAAFGPARPLDLPDASDWERALARLGRDPGTARPPLEPLGRA